jgi:hypothetical protein
MGTLPMIFRKIQEINGSSIKNYNLFLASIQKHLMLEPYVLFYKCWENGVSAL